MLSIRLGLAFVGAAVLLLSNVSVVKPVLAQEALPVAELQRSEPVSFRQEILPILRKSCIPCHNASEADADLVLEDVADILQGGYSGPAAEPGDLDESLLWLVASHQAEPVMPPEDNTVGAKNLSPEELGLLKLWIEQGLPKDSPGQPSAEPTLKWQPLPAGVNPIFALAVSPDGQFAVSSRANQAFVYHLPTRQFVARMHDPAVQQLLPGSLPGVAHVDLIQSIAFSPSGDLFATGSYREVKLWQRSPVTSEITFGDADTPGGPFASLADASLVALSSDSGEIKLFNIRTGEPLRNWSAHTGAIRALTFLPDGASPKLLSIGEDLTLKLWNAQTGELLAQQPTIATSRAAVVLSGSAQAATADEDGKIRIWTLQPETPSESPTPTQELSAHEGPVTALLQSSDAQLLSGGADGLIKVWEISSGKELRNLPQGAEVLSLALSPDNTRLVSSDAHQRAKLWDFAEGKLLTELQGDSRIHRQIATQQRAIALQKLQLEAFQKQLEAARTRDTAEKEALVKANERKDAADKSVTEKQAAAEQAQTAFTTVQAELETAKTALESAKTALATAQAALAAAASPATEQGDGAENTSPANTNPLDATPSAEPAESSEPAPLDRDALQAAVDTAQQAVTDAEAKLKAQEEKLTAAQKTKTEADVAVTAATTEQVTLTRALASAQGVVAAAAAELATSESSTTTTQTELTAAEAQLAELQAAAAASASPIESVAFSPSGLSFALSDQQGLLQTYTSATGTPLDTIATQAPTQQLQFSTEQHLLLRPAAGPVALWNLSPEWQLLRTIGNLDQSSTLTDRVQALAFSPDGKLLATGSGEPSRSGELKLWQIEDGALLKTIENAHADTVYALAFSPDGRHLTSGGADRFLKVWNLETGEMVRNFEGHTHHVLGTAWKTNGKEVASVGADATIKLWNFVTGDQIRTIAGNTKEIGSIAYVGDQSRVVVSIADKTVKLYDSDSGKLLRSFSGATEFLYSVSVTPDEKAVVAGGHDSILRMWNLEDGKLLLEFAPPENNP